MTGEIGETVVEITATTGGVATAGVEIAGTTAGVETAGEQVKAASGRTQAPAGGILDPMIVAGGTDRTITAGGTIGPPINARAPGHATFAGGETSLFLSGLIPPRCGPGKLCSSYNFADRVYRQASRSTNCASRVALKHCVVASVLKRAVTVERSSNR